MPALTSAAAAIALTRVAAMTSAAVSLLQSANQVSNILRTSHAEGREMTEEEMAICRGTDDAAKTALDKAIADARAAG